MTGIFTSKTLCNNVWGFYFNLPWLEMGSFRRWLCNTVGHILKIFTIGRPAPCCPPLPPPPVVSASPASFAPHLWGELTCGFPAAQARRKDGKERRKRKANVMRARSCQELRGWEGEITRPATTRGERGGRCCGARGQSCPRLPLPLVGRCGRVTFAGVHGRAVPGEE